MKIAMRPIVYLDSSDYSVLSDPARETSEVKSIRKQLLSWSRTGAVDFRYSQVHISEMAPTRSDKLDEAVKRIELLSQLCGSKCLIGYWEVFQLEKLRVLSRDQTIGTVFSDSGDWFSGIDEMVAEMVLKVSKIKEEGVDEKLKEVASNRAQKRKAMGLLRRKSVGVVEKLSREVPLRLQDRLAFGQYLVGKVSESSFKNALNAAARDPACMVRWVNGDHDKLSSALSFLRGPSSGLQTKMTTLQASVSAMRKERALQVPGNSAVPEIDGISRAAIFDEMVSRSESELDFSVPRLVAGSIDWRTLEACAPGLLTALRMHLSVAMTGVTERPRKAVGSDFLDILHTVYAPYVHVFRADRFMTPLVKKAMELKNTQVVGGLEELVSVIEVFLARSRA